MRCQEVESKISAFMDDELDSGVRQTIEIHLDSCGGCLEQLEGLRKLDGLLQELPRVHVAPEFAEKLALEVRTEAAAIEKSPFGRLGFLNGLLTLAHDFFDLLERPKSPSTNTLDEFNDFPPLSMGYIYCRLLKQCGGE